MVTIKIEFDTKQNLTPNTSYQFINPTNSEIMSAVYSGDSRIDGYPIFIVYFPPVSRFFDFTLNNIKIKELSLIPKIEDQFGSGHYSENKDILLDYFMREYNITSSDLANDSKFKSIMRELHIDKVLKPTV